MIRVNEETKSNKFHDAEKLATAIKSLVLAGLVPFIQGSPGIGKSAITRSVAKSMNLKIIDVRLSQCDVTDLNGMPKTDERKSKYLPFDTFPLEDDEIPAGYDGWLLFFDEVNSAKQGVQGAAYKIILDRMVGLYNLHPKCYIVAAGNYTTDGAVAYPMSRALVSRFAMYQYECNTDAWLKWGINNGINAAVLAHLKNSPKDLYTFADVGEDDSDDPYACPRTWQNVSKFLNSIEKNNEKWKDEELRPVLAGMLGDQVVDKFMVMRRYQSKLDRYEDIVTGRNNGKYKVSEKDDLGLKYMQVFSLIGNLHAKVDVNNLPSTDQTERLFDYVDNLGKEIVAVFLKGSCSIPSVKQFLQKDPNFSATVQNAADSM